MRSADSSSENKVPQGSRYDIGADEYVDTNGSGLPDWWQYQYFNTLGVNPAALSPGQDGMTNLANYQSQMDPINPIDSNGISYAWELQYFGQLHIDPMGDINGNGYPNIYKYTHNVSATGVPAPDLFVDPSNPSAFPTIQSALNATSKNYQIIAAVSGTYKENLSVTRYPCLLQSLDGAANTTINPGQNSLPILSIQQSCVLNGFTLTNSNAGAVNVSAGGLYMTNCLIDGNTNTQIPSELAIGGSAGLSVSSATATVTNCTFFNNVSNNAVNGYTIQAGPGGIISLQNTILWDDGNEIIEMESISTASTVGQVTATYSDIKGISVFSGTGNINQNPLLYGNGHLEAGSPCIDTGTAQGAPNYDMDDEPRPQGNGYDMGADEYVSTDSTGLPAWWQAAYGSNPSTLEPNGLTNLQCYLFNILPTNTNPIDSNQISYAWEVKYFNQIGINPNADPTGKGLTNLQEYQLGLNPLAASTAGDGILDQVALALNLSPVTAPIGLDPIGQGSSLSRNIDGTDLGVLTLPPSTNTTAPTFTVTLPTNAVLIQ